MINDYKTFKRYQQQAASDPYQTLKDTRSQMLQEYQQLLSEDDHRNAAALPDETQLEDCVIRQLEMLLSDLL